MARNRIWLGAQRYFLDRDFLLVDPPGLQVQRKIGAMLDKFDALVNDLSSGLPAEIAARRKQYAYYRDKLLTFPEKRSA